MVNNDPPPSSLNGVLQCSGRLRKSSFVRVGNICHVAFRSVLAISKNNSQCIISPEKHVNWLFGEEAKRKALLVLPRRPGKAIAEKGSLLDDNWRPRLLWQGGRVDFFKLQLFFGN